MSRWTQEHTKTAFKLMHKSDGCKFVPWFMHGTFEYAICFTCDKKITPDEWHKIKEAQ